MIPDRSIALALAALTALSRIPLTAGRLWEWDSVLYARSLELGFHVDDVLAGSRPHPPGYIFYVASAAVGRALGLDSDHALIAVGIAASAVGTAACYLLCRRFAGRGLSIGLSLAFATSPLVWLHSEVAMPYILLAPISAGLALAFRDARRAGGRRIVVTSLAFGALGGFRQDLLLFLVPLWAWSLAGTTTRSRIAAIVALISGCLVWFTPSALLSDGPLLYVARTVRQLTGLGATSANGERSIPLNLVLIGDSVLWAGLTVTVLVFVLGLARALAGARGQRRADDGEARFFAIWLLPALLFYLFVHIGEWGFVLSLVPGLYALGAWLLGPLARRSPGARRVVSGAIYATAMLGTVLFLAGDHPVFSRASLLEHDRSTDVKTAFIRDRLPAETTVVFATAEALVASYYLPEYAVRYANRAATTAYDLRITGITTIVVYEPGARPVATGQSRQVVGPGVALEIIAVAPDAVVVVPGPDLGDLRIR